MYPENLTIKKARIEKEYLQAEQKYIELSHKNETTVDKETYMKVYKDYMIKQNLYFKTHLEKFFR